MLASGALAVLGLPVVRLLYEHGRFTTANSNEVAGLLVILSCAVPGWVLQQVGVRGFYARGEMWRAMALSTVIAISVFPLYLWGGQAGGIRGLAMASATAITVNATITIIWLRLRCGAPNLATLAETFVRTALITLTAAAVTTMLLQYLKDVVTSPFVSLVLGGGSYALTSLLGIRWLGDTPLREALENVLSRIRRGSSTADRP
jgi:putative peptidoglycan lipid II flippase